MIDNIQPIQPPKYTDNAPQLLYFYVPLGVEEKGDSVYLDMLKTFWEQAIRGPEKRAEDHFGRYPSIKHVEEELHELLARSRHDIFIVIDALDQLPHRSHDLLFDGLNTMSEKLQAENKDYRLSLAISSRDRNGIDELQGCGLFTIEVTPWRTQHAIETYLEKKLKSSLLNKQEELKKRIHDELVKQSNGMSVTQMHSVRFWLTRSL